MEMPPMPKSHQAYAPEFRRQLVELVRSGSCASSAISWQRQQPGSHGRPQWSQPGLPIYEHEPGPLPHRHHGTRARRVDRRLLCLAFSAAICTLHLRCDPCRLARRVWRASRVCRVDSRGFLRFRGVVDTVSCVAATL